MNAHLARLPFLSLVLLALLPRVGSAGPVETKAYVATTDFSTGSMSAVTLASRAVQVDVASVYSDATLRWWGGKLYVVNRLGADNIQVVDPAQGFATVQQFSVGPGSNPQDIAVVSPTKAYVSCLGSASLQIVNPAAGTVTGAIPLAGFADSDGIPDAAHLAIAGGYLFVALQRLTNFQPVNTSMVAVVDLAADTVVDVDPWTPGVQAIPLVGRNPVTRFAYDPFTQSLLIGCAGAFGVLDGGIEAIPLAGGGAIVPGQPRWQSTGNVITEPALGGDIGEIGFLLPGHSYAIVSDASYHESVVSWNALTGQKLATIYAPGGFNLPDLAVSLDRDELWVCDAHTTTPGLHVFQCSTDTQVAGPLDTGLPPYQIAFDRDDVTIPLAPAAGVAGGARPSAALALSAPWPDPARERVSLRLDLPRAGDASVEVLDLAGRRVRVLASGARPAGESTVGWDLRDEGGNRAAPGMYLVRARMGEMSITRKVVTVR